MVISGVIRPPPDIRAVADRTASYVAKNGRAFEARILNSEKGKTPKFAFLHPTSPFHAYYEDRIKFFEEGGDDAAEEKKPEPEKKPEAKEPKSKLQKAPRKKEKTKKASAVDPVAKSLLEQRAKINKFKNAQKEASEGKEGERQVSTIPPPPPLELVSIVAPSNLPPSQIEAIQLVAQFAALDGKSGTFLQQLVSREWNNPEFAFCQPRHAHFAYFSALVDAYRRILDVRTMAASTKSDTPAAVATSQATLVQAAYRAEYQREMDQQKDNVEDGEVSAIDWHDFVVVETIEFPVDEVVELSMLPPPPPTPLASDAPPAATAAKPDENAMEESDEEEEETIRVVPSYTPKVVAPSNPQNARAIDPITGKSVSVADMPEHMRIQLLDPKWAEERKKFQDKQKDSNLVGGDAIVNNISRLAQSRGDTTVTLNKERDAKRRLEEANHAAPAQQPGPPGLPPMARTMPVAPAVPGPPPGEPPSEPASKRLRMDAPPIPPPPPPQAPAAGPPPGHEPPPNPMAGGPMPSNTETESTEKRLLPEAEFAASLSRPEVTLQIRIPNDPSQMAWNFYGQILSLTVNVMSKVKEVKADLSRLHLNAMPANKIQFKDPNTGFLKDSMTLASLNIGPTATLEMVPKTRGGRR